MRVLAWLRSLPHPVRRLLPALLCLAAAVEAFAYHGLGRIDRSVAADSLALAERIQAGSGPLRRRLRELSAAPAPDGGTPDAGAPPLKQVAALASEAGIRIVRLVPRSKEEALLDAEIAGGFPGFLQFVRGIETMGGALQGWQLRPAGEGGPGADRSADSRTITFTLDMRGRPLRPAAQAVSAGSANLRDPFRPKLTAQAAGVVDLSGQYRLTAVSQFGAAAMATIDGRDYLEDDKLGDMVITSIGDGAVSLSSGGRQYRLGFTQSRTQRSACTAGTC